jgi:hypothetical protein
MKHLEFIVFGFITVLMIIVIVCEIYFLDSNESNFVLDHCVYNVLLPKLESTSSIDEVYNLLDDNPNIRHLECTACNWRQVVSLSVVTSVMTVIIIRIFHPLPVRITILLFISLMSILTLLISLINTHYYEVRLNLYKKVLLHMRTLY